MMHLLKILPFFICDDFSEAMLFIISTSLAIRIAEQSAYATEESLVPSVGPHM